MQPGRPSLLVLTFLGIISQGTLGAEPSPVAPVAKSAELLSNGDFAAATKDPTWPDEWHRKPGLSWEVQSGAHFLRFAANEPEKQMVLSRVLPIPPGVSAVRVTFRYRTKDLQLGREKESSAYASFRYFDTVKIRFSPAPKPIHFLATAADWTVITESLLVPDHAVELELSFGLSQVEAGSLDVASISLKNVVKDSVPTGSAPSSGASDAEVPVSREGDRTIIGYGKPSVWFINPYVDVVGHDFDVGISHLVSEAKEQGVTMAVGVAKTLDNVDNQDESELIYVFSYKNINFPLPAQARRLIFLNTWLTPSTEWPASRSGKKDVVFLGSKIIHENADDKMAYTDRWWQLQKSDPALKVTVLDSMGYYLPLSAWREPLLKLIFEDRSGHP